MRRAPWFMGLLLASPLIAFGADAPITSVDFSASAWVDVDASGQAHVIEMGKLTKLGDVTKLAPIADSIRERLRERIESWQFVPAMRDGAAVASSTNVYFNLEALDDGAAGLAVRLRSAYTGPELEERNMTGLMMADTGEEGMVVIDVTYREDGHVQSAVVHDSKAFEGGQFVKRVSQDLRKGSMRAAKLWVFKPEQVAGKPVAGSGRVPVIFCVTVACGTAWHDSSIADSEPRYASNEPVAKLRSNVAGTAL